MSANNDKRIQLIDPTETYEYGTNKEIRQKKKKLNISI